MMLLPFVAKLRCLRGEVVGAAGSMRNLILRHNSGDSSGSSSSGGKGGSAMTLPISQGGTIIIDFSNAPSAKINITSKWQDFCLISSESIDHPLIDIGAVDKDKNLCEISFKGGEGEAEASSNIPFEPFFDITVPEIINLTIIGNHLDLSMKNKLMGDIDVICSSGKVNIDKVRGESLNFNCGEADIKVSKLMEGTSNVACRSFYGKMVNGEDIKILSMQDVTIGAMYGDTSSINCMRNVYIDLAKGNTNINANGLASLKGVDGRFDVRAQGKIDVQINKLSPGSSSTAVSNSSTVSAKIDPDLTYNLECRSDTSTARNSITIVSEGFTKHDDDIINVDQNGNPKEIQTVVGIVRPIKNSNKRPDFDFRSKSSGKIDLSGAEAQSLNTVTKQSLSDASIDNTDNDISSGIKYNGNCPSLLLSSKGHIRVESLSWMEAIVRNHGLENVYKSISSDKVKIGRTASASIRAREILKEKEA